MQREPDFIFERQTGGAFLPRYRSAPTLILKASANQPLELLALEDRVLYSAAPLDLPDPASAEASAPNQLEQQINELIEWTSLLASSDLVETTSAGEEASPGAIVGGSVLVVVDRGIKDYQTLLDDIQKQLPEEHSLLLIDSASDGWLQLNQYLSQHQGIQQVHLFSHGAAGQLLLGNQSLQLDDLFNDEAAAIWQRALRPDADVYLYGCELAAGQYGEQFVSQFAIFSDADVAASVDQTGNIAGSDWNLEFTVGSMNDESLFYEGTSLTWRGSLDPQTFSRAGAQDLSGPDRGSTSAVAVNSNGSYVVVWTEQVSGNGLDILACHFNADGTQNGSVFTVNQRNNGDQRFASVDMDSSGRFVITWTGIDNGNDGVLARLYAANGTALTDEFVVNTFRPSAQYNSSVSMAQDGRFVIAWEGNGAEDSQGIYAQRYDSNGNALGSQIFVNSSASGAQENPTVSMNSSGAFVVAWNDETSFRYQRFDSNGNKLDQNGVAAAEITVSAIGTARYGDVLLNHDGTVVTTWQEFNSTQWEVFFEKDAFDGSSLISKTPILSNTTSDQLAPSIDGSGSGEFIITWEGREAGDIDGGVFYQPYNATGLATPYTLLANGNYTTNHQGLASVAATSLENYVIVWTGNSATDTSDIGHNNVRNAIPVAVANTTSVSEAGGYDNSIPGSMLPVNVLLNDTDIGDTLTVVGVVQGSGSFTTSNIGTPISGTYGTLTLAADGSFTYGLNELNSAVQALRTSADTLTETFTYTVRDSGYMVSTAALTITITGQNDAPTGAADSATAVEAGGVNNGTAGTNPAGNVLTNDTDPDAGDTKTVTGVAAGSPPLATGSVGVAVAGTYGSLTINANGAYVYTVNNSSTAVQALRNSSETLSEVFTYTFSDVAGLTATNQLTITIQGANDTPTVNTLTPPTIAENIANGTLVTTASATEVDSGDTLIFSLSNNAGGRFAINSATGEITVANSALLNFESATSHSITIRATDGAGAFHDRSLTINLSDVNEFDVGSITDANSTSNSVAENAANGTTVGLTATANDNDATNNTITYSLDNTAGERFAINSTTGVVTVADGTLLNRETAASYTIIVRATSTDSSFSTQSFTITLSDVDEFDTSSISDSNVATNSVAENSPSGTTVGITAFASDSDATTNTITYSLDNDAEGRFSIDSATGVVTVANGTLLNFEAATSHSIAIRASSSDGSSSTLSLTISLTDVDENVGPITDSNSASNSIAENSANGATVGITATASDPDATNNTITYTLDDDASGRFVINGTTGVVTVANSTLLDREAAASHSITVRASSSDGSSSLQTFTITLSDVDEFDVGAISDANASANTVAENAANGTTVGITAAASDADGTNNTITYSLDSDAGGRFAINSSTGVVTVANGSLLNYEAATNHSITIRATSADSSFTTQTFTINLNDVDEFDVGAISDANATTNLVNELAPNGSVAGITAVASDGDATNNAITYSLDDSAGGRFTINSSTGVVTVANNSLLNYEAATNHAILVRATSADGSFSTQSFTINVSDFDEFDVGSVTDSNSSPNSVTENASNGATVGITATANDSDGTNNAITYSLDNDAGGRFAINPGTGVVSVADGTLLDLETSASHTITVRATSADGSSSTQSFTINLSNQNENPTASNDSAVSVEAGGIANGTAGINPTGNVFTNDSDPDSGDTKTIVGVAAGTPASATGQVGTSVTGQYGTLILNANGSYSFVLDNSNSAVQSLRTAGDALTDTFTYTMADSGGLQSTARLSILITGANDNPTDQWSEAGLQINQGSSNNQYVRLQDFDQLISNQLEFTLRVSISTTQTTFFLVSYATNSDDNEFRIYAYDGTLRLSFAGWDWNTNIASSLVADGERHELAAVRDAWTGGLKLFIDGNLAAQTSSFLTLATPRSGGTAVLAQDQDSNGGSFNSTQFFRGTIWELSFYDTAWSNSRVASETGTVSNAADLLGHWSFDSASGGQITDDVGGRHGVLRSIFGTGWTNGTPATVQTDWLNPINENLAIGSTIGFLTASDLDSGDGITWHLSNDADGRFAVNSSTGEVTVANSSLINRENSGSHQITAVATDSAGGTHSRTYLVEIKDVDEFNVSAISDGNAAANQVNENASSGTLVGITASATDADATNNTITYSLDNSAGGRFAINATTGAVRVNNSSLLNYESATSHTITVRATSSDGSTSTQSFTININDIDEFNIGPVTDSNSANNSVNENALNGTTVGIIANAIDPDGTNNTVTYSLDNSAGNRFAIDSSTGVVTVANSSLLDREAAASYSITIRATSSDNSSSTQTFTITLNDIDEFNTTPISDTNSAASVISENSANGAFVGITATASDGDATTNTITYSLDDSAGGRFTIDSSTGIVTVANSALLNFEVATSHSIIVRATSADGSSSTQSFNIDLTDFDEFDVGLVSDSNPAINSVAENAANGTAIGIKATAADSDATTSTITYSLDDSAGGRFTIDSSTGIVTVANGTLLNFEVATSHNIIVRATSADGSFSTQSFTVNLTDVDEFDVGPVQDSNAAANSLAENSANGTIVGITASANDSDSSNSTITYSLDDSAGGRFTIDAATGVVSVANSSLLDRETAASHSITVRAASTDGSFSTQAFTITLTDIDEFDVTPTIDANPAANSVAENAVNGTSVGVTATASDSDTTTNSITYSLDDSAGGRFTIDSATGVVSVVNSSLLDREAASSHSITVRSTSADGSFSTETFTISLTDIDEFDVSLPVDSNPAANSVIEGAADGSLVGLTASASDSDATNNTVTWSLDDSAGGRFAIDPNSGVVTVANGSLLDRETASSHTIAVRATSNDGSVSVSVFQIQIENVNESPIANADQALALEAGGLANNIAGVNPTGNVLANDSDIDLSDTRRVVGIQAGTHATTSGSVGDAVAGLYGSLFLNADGSYTYILNNNDPAVEALRNSGTQLSDTFSYTVRDAGGLESTTQLSIAVQGSSDTPDSMWSETGLQVNEGTSNNQYLEVENFGNLLSGDEFTLRLSVTSSHSNSIFLSYATSSHNNELVIRNQGSKLTVYLRGQAWTTAINSSLVTDGERHEIALVRTVSDGGLRVFIDGVLKDSTTGLKSGQQLTGSGTLILGQEQDRIGGSFAANQIFRGTYWDFSVHSTAWTGGKVHLNVGQTFHDLPDLRGHWDFELSGGDTVFDQIGTRHGSLKSIPAGGVWVAGTAEQVRADWKANLIENAANGTVVANLRATDIDQGEQLRWSLTDNAGGRFAIDASTGRITVADSSQLNFEHLRDHQIQVRVTDDSGLFREETYQIRLTDVQETGVSIPVDDNLAANTVLENSPNRVLVGLTAWAIDQDGTTNRVTYSLDDDADGRFAIDPDTGIVSVANGSLLDRESAANHNIIIRATSEDGTSATQLFTIEVGDVSEFPVGIISDADLSPNLIRESASSGTQVGIVAQATDPDATNNLVRFSLEDDAGGRFVINELTGVVTVAGDGMFDFESTSSMSITVRASSEDGSHVSQIMVIDVVDVDEYDTGAVIDLDTLDNVVHENSVIGTYTGLTAFAEDADATNNRITYRLANDDGGRFSIDEATGRVYTHAMLDFETDGGFRRILVEASSEDGSSTLAEFSIELADVYKESFSTYAGMDVEFSPSEILESNRDGNYEITNLTIENAPEFGDLMILGPSGPRMVTTREIGSLAISPNEKLLYVSPATTRGNVTLGYTAMNNEGRERTGMITIMVEAAAPPPPPPPTISFTSGDSSSNNSSNSSSERSSSGGDSPTERSVIAEPDSSASSSNGGEASSAAASGPVMAVGPITGSGGGSGAAFEFADDAEKKENTAETSANRTSGDGNQQNGTSEGESGVFSSMVNLIQASGSDNYVSTGDSGLVTRVFATAAAIEEKLTNSTQFTEYLSKLETALQQTPVVVGFEMPAYASAGASLFTVGYVAWLIRGGVLLTSFMSSLPSWQSFDPLPILENAGSGDGDSDADGSDSSIAELVDSEQPVPSMSGIAG